MSRYQWERYRAVLALAALALLVKGPKILASSSHQLVRKKTTTYCFLTRDICVSPFVGPKKEQTSSPASDLARAGDPQLYDPWPVADTEDPSGRPLTGRGPPYWLGWRLD